MSEQEELRPLLGSLEPVVPAPAPVEPEENRAIHGSKMEAVEPKKESKAPKLATEGDKIIYQSALKVNAYEGNSESVKTVQLRLVELGFDSCMNDKYGRLGNGSVEAINAFRKSKGLKECGCFDEEVLAHLFAGTNVGVRP
jgi:peptidoglycan hydrolase-like protein with peptidoglycan-binding domain